MPAAQADRNVFVTAGLKKSWLNSNAFALMKDDRESFEVRVISPEKLKVHVVNAGGGPVFDIDFEK